MGRLGFDSLAGILNFRAVQKMTYRTRLALLRHLQRLSAEYHDNTSPGDTLHRLQMDVDQVGTLTSEVIPVLLRTTTIFTLVMTTMLVLNYRLTIVVLPLIPLFILVRRRFQDRLRDASDAVQQQSGKLIGFLEEHLSAIVQVQLLCGEQREALVSAFTGKLGGPLAELADLTAEVVGIHAAAIALAEEGGATKVALSPGGSADMSPITGSTGRTTTLADGALSGVLGTLVEVGKSTGYRVDLPGDGFDLDVTGRSANRGRFAYRA